MQYTVVQEAESSQMYLKIYQNNEFKEKTPLGIYKFEKGKLVFCEAKSYQKTIGIIPFGAPRHEFPKDFIGACMSMEKK